MIHACYSWEVALNICLHASFDNLQDWKGLQEKGGRLNSTKTNETVELSGAVILVKTLSSF
jgi:hypothetical protein